MFKRFECALLKNLLDDTPVIPVFIAEKIKDKDEYTPVSRSVVFPSTCHARSEDGIALISYLQYDFICYFFPCFYYFFNICSPETSSQNPKLSFWMT